MHGIKATYVVNVVNKHLENLTKLKCIDEEIKSRLTSGNAYHNSFKILLSSRLLSRNKTIISPVVLYECLTLMEEIEGV
jgi:hypothetical protein